MFEAVEGLLAEHAELEQRLADPAVHADQALAQAAQPALRRADRDRRAPSATGSGSATTSRPPASSPPRTRRSPPRPSELDARREAAPRSGCGTLLVPRDPTDDKDVILEIKAGEGGEESALFAGDLLRMYIRYAERRGWKTEVLDATESDLGGYKSVTVAVKAKGTPEPGEAPYALLKFEGGVHRVQRVPVTESPGPRPHLAPPASWCCPRPRRSTSRSTTNDLRIDVFRSSAAPAARA